MYIFPNLAYFFNQDFSQEIEYMDDNVCKTLIFCFSRNFGAQASGIIQDLKPFAWGLGGYRTNYS